MTRINLVPVEELMDQHLMAEYRELLMVPSALRRSLRTLSESEVLKRVPSEFVLGKGHVSFFYDKLFYLRQRYHLLQIELTKRGFQLDPYREFPPHEFQFVFYGDYVPTDAALALIRERIQTRIEKKPTWYRKTTYSS